MEAKGVTPIPAPTSRPTSCSNTSYSIGFSFALNLQTNKQTEQMHAEYNHYNRNSWNAVVFHCAVLRLTHAILLTSLAVPNGPSTYILQEINKESFRSYTVHYESDVWRYYSLAILTLAVPKLVESLLCQFPLPHQGPLCTWAYKHVHVYYWQSECDVTKIHFFCKASPQF